MSRYIVTITPPTPNGDLHLGHLSGPFLAADVCARVLRHQGHEAVLLSYSDDYQSYLLRRGREQNKDPMLIAAANARAIGESLRSVDVDLTHFLLANGNRHFLDEANRYFALIENAGQVYTETARIPHCEPCGVYGYEGFGRGRCSYCDSPSDASQCEVCARAPRLERMGSLSCVLCKRPMSYRRERRMSWRIGATYAALRRLYAGMNHRSALAAYLREVLAQEDDTWALTRPGEAAIPNYAHPDQPIHTWFAGLAGYRAALREYLEYEHKESEIDAWWSDATTLVQFLGFDCSYSHAVAYAAQLLHEPTAPRRIYHFTNRFLKLDGEDFSTSRNHAVWVNELSAAYPADAVRLYAALYSPEDEVKNFDRLQFRHWCAETYGRQLAAGDWSAPGAAAATPLSDETLARCQPWLARWHRHATLDHFSVTGLAQAALGVAALVAETPARERDALWLLYGELAQALHPSLSARIRQAIGARSPHLWSWYLSAAILETHHV